VTSTYSVASFTFPAEKAGKEIDKAVLEGGKTALEKAKKVGKVLEEAAEETAEKVKEATE